MTKKTSFYINIIFYMQHCSRYYLKANPEGMRHLIPVGAKHDKLTYLAGRAHVLAYTRTNIIIAYSDKPDGLAGIRRYAVKRYVGRNMVAVDELISHGQVIIYQTVHLTLYFLFLLP